MPHRGNLLPEVLQSAILRLKPLFGHSHPIPQWSAAPRLVHPKGPPETPENLEGSRVLTSHRVSGHHQAPGSKNDPEKQFLQEITLEWPVSIQSLAESEGSKENRTCSARKLQSDSPYPRLRSELTWLLGKDYPNPSGLSWPIYPWATSYNLVDYPESGIRDL